MLRLTRLCERGGLHLFLSLALLFACSGCPESSEPFEEKIPSQWIHIAPASESQAAATLSWADVERLKATVPTIVQIVAERNATVTVKCDGQSREIDLCETSPDMLRLVSDVAGTTVIEGRFLAAEDSRQDPSVIVLAQPLAEELFVAQSPIGKKVTIGGKELVVIGTVIAGEHGAIRPAGHDAYVPAMPTADAKVDCIWVNVRTLDDVSATREVIVATLEKMHEGAAFRVE